MNNNFDQAEENQKQYLISLSWNYIALFLLLIIILFGSSCSKRYQDLPAFLALPINDSENNSVGRFKTSYLAEQIHAYFRGNVSAPIAVTTFVSIDDLYQTSTFGRVIAEQLISELSMLGYNVVEVRLADAMQILYDGGELVLSRETKTLKHNLDLSAVVVGTYTVSPVRVYINARIVDPATSMVISAGSVEMSKTAEINRLLKTNSFPSTLERIPVRHLSYSQYQPYPVFSIPGSAAGFSYPNPTLDQNAEPDGSWNVQKENNIPQQDGIKPSIDLSKHDSQLGRLSSRDFSLNEQSVLESDE